jgi:hypothetical protein
MPGCNAFLLKNRKKTCYIATLEMRAGVFVLEAAKAKRKY